MSHIQLTDPEQDADPGQVPARGPSAHEDLTIAEHISTMLAKGEHRPDEHACLDEHGHIVWLPETKLEDFIRTHGSEHPSDYLAKYGRPWQQDFFSNHPIPNTSHS